MGLSGCGLGSSRGGSGSPVAPMPSRTRERLPEEAPPQPMPLVERFDPPAREPLIRVRVARSAGAKPIVLGGEGSGRQWLRVSRATERPGEGAVLLVLAGPLRVDAERNGWSIVDATGHRTLVDGGDPIEIASQRGELPRIVVEGTTYPGIVRLVARSRGDVAGMASDGAGVPGVAGGAGVDAINVCPMEQYLPGVLARELYASWNLQTYLAQAIAARSFATFESLYWASRRHFDVVAGQASQAYVGLTANSNANRAARESVGTLLTYANQVVPGYYSSCCGGVSASAVDAISEHAVNDVPPLRARPPQACCAWAPVFRWTSEQASGDAGRRLAAWSAERQHLRLPAMGQVAAIEPTQVNPYGRPIRFRISDGRGTSAELLAEQLRVALNASAPGLAAPTRPVRSGNLSAVLQRGTLVCSGQGFGHGVGLCQHGAEGMAREGVRWRAIVENYYPGATISRAWA